MIERDEHACTNEEFCARCGDVMLKGETVVDMNTDDDMPWATAEWATVHKRCEHSASGKGE